MGNENAEECKMLQEKSSTEELPPNDKFVPMAARPIGEAKPVEEVKLFPPPKESRRVEANVAPVEEFSHLAASATAPAKSGAGGDDNGGGSEDRLLSPEPPEPPEPPVVLEKKDGLLFWNALLEKESPEDKFGFAQANGRVEFEMRLPA